MCIDMHENSIIKHSIFDKTPLRYFLIYNRAYPVFDQYIKVRKAITKLWYFQSGPNASIIFIQLSRLCRNRISVLHFITNRNSSKYWLSLIFSKGQKSTVQAYGSNVRFKRTVILIK